MAAALSWALSPPQPGPRPPSSSGSFCVIADYHATGGVSASCLRPARRSGTGNQDSWAHFAVAHSTSSALGFAQAENDVGAAFTWRSTSTVSGPPNGDTVRVPVPMLYGTATPSRYR